MIALLLFAAAAQSTAIEAERAFAADMQRVIDDQVAAPPK